MSSDRFTYVKYDEISVIKQEAFKKMFEAVESYATENLCDSRAKSLIFTALEVAYMWTGKAIRDEQMNRTQAKDIRARLAGCDQQSESLTMMNAREHERSRSNQ